MVIFINCIVIICYVTETVYALPPFNYRKTRTHEYQSFPEVSKSVQKIYNGREESPLLVMYPMVGESRDKRNPPDRVLSEDDSAGGDIENASFEVPTSFRLNDSLGDLRVSVMNGDAAAGGCCPPRFPPPPPPPQPRGIAMTIAMDNLFPPEKMGKIMSVNSSEFRGCGVILRINFVDKPCPPTPCSGGGGDFVFGFENSTSGDRIESQKKKKMDEDTDDDEKMTDTKTLEEVLRRILSGVNASSSDSFLSKNSTLDPVTIVVDSRVLHKMTGKLNSSTVKGQDANLHSNVKSSQEPTDGDPIVQLVERLSSNLPREKLVSLFSNLLARVSSNNN